MFIFCLQVELCETYFKYVTDDMFEVLPLKRAWEVCPVLPHQCFCYACHCTTLNFKRCHDDSNL